MPFQATVYPIVNFLSKMNINIVQMPCPEIRYEGIVRHATKKDDYDTPQFREICTAAALEVRSLIDKLQRADRKILAILGIENSPTCGVSFVFRRGKGRVRESGMFIEELRALLATDANDEIPFIGVTLFAIEKTLAKISKIAPHAAPAESDITANRRYSNQW